MIETSYADVKNTTSVLSGHSEFRDRLRTIVDNVKDSAGRTILAPHSLVGTMHTLQAYEELYGVADSRRASAYTKDIDVAVDTAFFYADIVGEDESPFREYMRIRNIKWDVLAQAFENALDDTYRFVINKGLRTITVADREAEIAFDFIFGNRAFMNDALNVHPCSAYKPVYRNILISAILSYTSERMPLRMKCDWRTGCYIVDEDGNPQKGPYSIWHALRLKLCAVDVDDVKPFTRTNFRNSVSHNSDSFERVFALFVHAADETLSWDDTRMIMREAADRLLHTTKGLPEEMKPYFL